MVWDLKPMTGMAVSSASKKSPLDPKRNFPRMTEGMYSIRVVELLLVDWEDGGAVTRSSV